ncbi:hypothetical protein DPMN_110376 [Dreissena polymorpha]|uniref:Uncharacterized protein n=1 Tax=Dreissena polymorpha TaxID=45954 RepID=A0A9D4QMZ9_DREPO|nr:hypothetical protein DPMN_110376 [Dreissena polymorpha]
MYVFYSRRRAQFRALWRGWPDHPAAIYPVLIVVSARHQMCTILYIYQRLHETLFDFRVHQRYLMTMFGVLSACQTRQENSKELEIYVITLRRSIQLKWRLLKKAYVLLEPDSSFL